jgi:Fe-S-cluster containining protein
MRRKIELPVLRVLGNKAAMARTKDGAKTDCSYCRAPCCQFIVELRPNEISRFENEVLEYDGKKRHVLKRREDGYCVYYVPGKGCSTYEDKPWVCDHYSCRNDVRITPHLKYGKNKKNEDGI